MSIQRICVQAAALAACAILTACGGAANDGESPAAGGGAADAGGHANQANHIHLLVAAHGELTLDEVPGERPERGVLILRGARQQALWYADRPGRESGARPLPQYLGSGWATTYGRVDPNATLQFRPEGGTGIAGLYLTLSEPAHDPVADTVRFRVRVLNDTTEGPLPVKMAFSDVTLNVLNNVNDDKEVSSYVQHAAHASLRPAQADGRHVLTLTQASEFMFWVDNAPGT